MESFYLSNENSITAFLNAPIFVKFGLLSIPTSKVPISLGYFGFLFSCFQLFSIIMKITYQTLFSNTGMMYLIMEWFTKIFVFSDIFNFKKSYGIILFTCIIMTIYFLIILSVLSYFTMSILKKRIPNTVVVKIWNFIVYLHKQILFFPIYNFGINLIDGYFNDYFKESLETSTGIHLLIFGLFLTLLDLLAIIFFNFSFTTIINSFRTKVFYKNYSEIQYKITCGSLSS